VFEQEEDPSTRSFFSEIISSISDVRFSYDGRYILSRDYLTVKIWDVNMERQPIKTIPIHEHLRPRLCDTYENDSIFDKFEVVFSGDGKNVMTGSYNNNFMIYPSDPDQEIEIVLQADKSAFKAKKIGVPTPINSSGSPTANGRRGGSRAGSPAAGQGQRMRKETDADQIDFNKKILHMSWHPFEDSIAIAATNNVSSSPPSTFHLDDRPCSCSHSASSSSSSPPSKVVGEWHFVVFMRRCCRKFRGVWTLERISGVGIPLEGCSCADGKLGLARGHDRGAKLGGEAQVEATLERDWEDEDFTWNGSRILGWKTAGWGGGSVTRSGSPTPSPGVYNTIPGTRDGRTEHFLHGGRMRRGCKDGDLACILPRVANGFLNADPITLHSNEIDLRSKVPILAAG
jgi:hypothetical protein